MALPLSRSLLWFIGLALSIVFCSLLIVQSQVFSADPHWLSLGITMDIALGIPLLYYILMVRREATNWVTTLVVFLFSVGVAHWVLPNNHQYFLGFAEKALIVTESVVILYAISQIRKIIAAYRFSAKNNVDTIQNLQYGLEQVLGKHTGTRLAVNEIATFYYGLFFWRIRKEVRVHQTAFTYHRESAYPAMIGALLLVTIAETVGLHLLISRWSEALAIVFTILSAYSFLFLWADLVAVLKRPIVLEKDKLYLRIGLRWQASISLHQIEAIQPVPDTFPKSKDTLNVALLAPANALIIFNQPIEIQGLYGVSKTVQKVALPIDNYPVFEETLLEQKESLC